MSIEVIVKKVQKFLGVPSDALTIGSVRSQLSRDLLKTLTDVIEKKADYGKVYWIMVHSKIDPAIPGGHAIKERIIILPEKPQTRFLGACLFRIDPVLGDAEVEYILPLDIPGLSILTPEAGRRGTLKAGEASIMESAKGLPIVNRLN
jgi:hypothetical protein